MVSYELIRFVYETLIIHDFIIYTFCLIYKILKEK